MRRTLIIGVPKSIIQNGWYRLSVTIEVENGDSLPDIQKEFWFALPEDYADAFVFPDCSNCFLFGLLYFAMRLGYDIRIMGTISPKCLQNIQREVMPIMSAFRPCIQPVKIEVESTKVFAEGKYVGTGFSAGIDSFATIVCNLRDHSVFSEDKLTHLFFFNSGTHGLGRSFDELEKVRQKFLTRFESFSPAAKMIGLPFIPVDTNVHSFLPDNVAAAGTLANVCVVHFLRKGIRRYLLSSDGRNYFEWFTYMKNSPVETHIDLAYTEPLLCQWLGDNTLSIIPYGSSMTRIEKTQLLVDYAPAQNSLNVCNSVDTMEKNCSICLKCRRTMLDLDLLGKLDCFRNVFDIDKYRRCFRSRDYAEMIYPPPAYQSMFLNNSRHYALEHGIDIKEKTTFFDRLCAYLHQTWIYVFLQKINLLNVIKRSLGRHLNP